jgi:hypothetical protein
MYVSSAGEKSGGSSKSSGGTMLLLLFLGVCSYFYKTGDKPAKPKPVVHKVHHGKHTPPTPEQQQLPSS